MALNFLPNTTEHRAQHLLFQVIDPELNVNIVDLGLVYRIEIVANRIEIDMTLSSPGCPLGDVIVTDVYSTLKRHLPDYEPKVNLVWEPQWTPDLVTQAGRDALNF